MPEFISATIGIAAFCTALRGNVRQNLAMSDEGRFADAQVTEVWHRFEDVVSPNMVQGDLNAELDALVREHSNAGWDGNEAPPVTPETALNSRAFLRVLPADTPAPEFAVDPDDGAISFEWHAGYKKGFSVSVGPGSLVACAGIDGVERWHAALIFDGTALPQMIADSIRRICSEHATVGFA